MPYTIILKLLALAFICCLPIFWQLVDELPSKKAVLLAILLFGYCAVYIVLFVCLTRLNKKSFYLVATILVFYSASQVAYMLITGGGISYNAIASIYSTNSGEFFEFLGTTLFLKSIFLTIFICILTLFFYATIGKFKSIHVKKINFKTVVVTFSLSGLIALTLFNYQEGLKNYFPLNVINNNIQYFNETYKVANEIANLTYEYEGEKPKTTNNIILVIGESNRRDSLSVYSDSVIKGRQLKELTKLHSNNVLNYTKAISAAAFTRVAVPSLLSTAPAEKFSTLAQFPSIIRVLNSVNYSSFLFSNQSKGGFHNDLIKALISEIKNKVYFENSYDGAMLPIVNKLIDNDAESQFIVMHLMGSHYDYSKRYPESFALFSSDNNVDAYKNSVAYTEFVLSELANTVLAQSAPYAILYVSDHGEYLNDLGDGLFGHGMRNASLSEVEIPFIFIMNDEFIEQNQRQLMPMKNHLDKKISHDNVSHLILGLAGAKDSKFYDKTLDLSSEYFRENKRKLIDRDMNVIDFSVIENMTKQHHYQ